MKAHVKALRSLLRKRETNFQALCRTVPISPEAFSAVLNGKRDGRYTWPKLRSLFTEDERALVIENYGQVFED